MASFATHNFPDLERGDTFSDKLFTTNIPLAGYYIKAEFKFANSVVVKSLTTENGGVVVSGNNFTIASFPTAELSKGTYSYEIYVRKPNGASKTWIKGKMVITD